MHRSTNIYYFTVFLGHESQYGLVGYLYFNVSQRGCDQSISQGWFSYEGSMGEGHPPTLIHKVGGRIQLLWAIGLNVINLWLFLWLLYRSVHLPSELIRARVGIQSGSHIPSLLVFLFVRSMSTILEPTQGERTADEQENQEVIITETSLMATYTMVHKI